MQLPGIYVEIKGDYSHLQREIKAAKALVSEQSRGISDAINNALSPQQIKGSIDKMVAQFGTLNRASSVASSAFGNIGVDLEKLRSITGLTEQQFAKLQSQLLKTSTANAQENSLKRLASQLNLTEKEVRALGVQFGLTEEQISRVTAEQFGKTGSFIDGLKSNWLGAVAAIYAAQMALDFVSAPFVKGFKAVEEYNTAVASLAAMVVTFSERAQGQSLEDQWKGALAYSSAMVPVLENIAARTLLSGQETVSLANAFARSGVFLDANNDKQVESFTRISNALPLMTQGQEIMRQINTEIRSLMTGANESSSMMLTTLKAIDPEINAHLESWRKEGTVLENIGVLLAGFGPATALLENQWQAVKSTLDTTATQILRGLMKPAYESIIESAKDLNDWMVRNKDTVLDWGTTFRIAAISVQAEITRLAMLIDKVGGTMTSAQMLLYGPGTALGVESSTKRFEAAAQANIEYENRYKASDKVLEDLAKKQISLEDSRFAAKKKTNDETFKFKPKVTVDDSGMLDAYKKAWGSGARTEEAYNAMAKMYAEDRDNFVKSGTDKVTAQAAFDSQMGKLWDEYTDKGGSKRVANYNQANTKYLEYQKAFEEKHATFAKIAADADIAINKSAYATGLKNLADYLDDEHAIRQRAIDANITAKKNELANARSALGNVSPVIGADGDPMPDKDASNRIEILKKIEIAEKNLAEAVAKGEMDKYDFAEKRKKALIDSQIASTQSAISIAEMNGEWDKSIQLNQDLLNLEIKKASTTLSGSKESISWIERQNQELEKLKTPLGAFYKGLDDRAAQWRNTSAQMVTVAQETADAMQTAFSDFFFDSMQGKFKSLGDYIDAFLTSVQRSLANVMSQQVSSALLSSLSGIVSGGVSGGNTGSTVSSNFSIDSIFGSAHGNVFKTPSLSAYSNSIVDKPTFFAKGGNVMGEAGPEAIIPLTRTASGDLGVRSTGGGVVINVIESSNKAGTQQQRNENGVNIIDVFVEQIKSSVAGDIARGSGSIPGALQSTYGLNRAAGAY